MGTAELELLDGSAAVALRVVPPRINELADVAAAVDVPKLVTEIDPPDMFTVDGVWVAIVSTILTVVAAAVPSNILRLATLMAISPFSKVPLAGCVPLLVEFLNLKIGIFYLNSYTIHIPPRPSDPIPPLPPTLAVPPPPGAP